ncbi:MAG: hypothetical protein AAGA48_31275 [Myxococcota bacterium]
MFASLFLAWSSLYSCIVIVEDGVLYDCTCDVVFDDYAYYGLTDFYDVTTCDPSGAVVAVSDSVALDCVSVYSDGGYYYAACDCVCTESLVDC